MPSPPTTSPVREAAHRIMDDAEHVSVNRDAAADLAAQLAEETDFTVVSWDAPVYPSLENDSIESVVDFIIIGNALNYCFNDLETGEKYKTEYLDEEWRGAYGMWAALKKAYDSGYPILDPGHLKTLYDVEVRTLMEPCNGVELPMIESRVDQLYRVAELMSDLGGSFAPLFEDSVTLYGDDGVVEMLATAAAFRDERTYNGEIVRFDKRAQLAVSMLYGKLMGTPHEFAIDDIDEFTVFADYSIPATLAGHGVLEYSSNLLASVEAGERIPENDPREVEIRAATVVAGDVVKEALETTHGIDASIPVLDASLWQMRRGSDFSTHLTETLAY